jgi:phosphoribosylformylglycinamidine synthase
MPWSARHRGRAPARAATLGSAKPCDRPADGRAVRQGAEDAPRHPAHRAATRAALDTGRDRPARSGLRVLAHPGVGGEEVPDHHRRPQRRRPVRARPDGRPVADCRWPTAPSPSPISTATPARRCAHGRAHAAGPARRRRRRAHGGRRGDHQPAAAPVRTLDDIKLSANWMAAAGDAARTRAVRRGASRRACELCPALGLGIPVGKDSLSMQRAVARWQAGEPQVSPVSLIVSAFARVADVRQTS